MANPKADTRHPPASAEVAEDPVLYAHASRVFHKEAIRTTRYR